MHASRSAILIPASLLMVGCTMLVPNPNATSAPPVGRSEASSMQPPSPVVAVSLPGAPGNHPASAATLSGSPILLRRLSTLEQPDGALIITRGTILDDVAAFAGGKPLIHDPVLDDRGGSLRLAASPDVVRAAGAGPRLVKGVLSRSNGRLRLRAEQVNPVPPTEMRSLTLDDRPRESSERIAITPGLHRISLEASGIARVEFLLDDDDGPLARIDVDGLASDGFSALWSAAADQRVTVRTIGFTLFDEQVTGPTMDVLVGPPLHS